VKCLKIVAADSAAALLDTKFKPLSMVSVAAVLVNPPYREASECLTEQIFADARSGHELIIHEAEVCRDLLAKAKADVVHLDMSLGGISVEKLSPIQFSNMRVSSRARRHLLSILPRLRKISGEIIRLYGIEVLAVGKESVPVRVAELTAGAYAILYASEKAVKESRTVLLGLPSKCQHYLVENGVYLHSLIAAEHDVRGRAEDAKGILKRVDIVEMLNPCARGFRALKISPKASE
jgi:hypothetical protein